MKRNSIFMWAYISFIFVSVLVRIFVDYPIWKELVFSVTITCFFYAEADFFRSMKDRTQAFIDATEPLILKTQPLIDEDIDFFTKVDGIIDLHSEESESLIKLKSTYYPIKEKIIELNESNVELENIICKQRRSQKHYQRASFVLVFVGSFFLFATYFLASFFTISTFVQEMVTVLSFAVILMTQQLDGILLERAAVLTSRVESVIQDFDMHQEIGKQIKESINNFLGYTVYAKENTNDAD